MLENEKWANSKTIELHREKEYRIINDGDQRVTKWPGTWQTAEPIAEMHTYTNKTQCSSTMRFLQVTEEDVEKYGLFNYPTFYGGYEVVTIMDNNSKYWRMADQYFRYLNGVLGPKKLLRIWVLIFRDKPKEAFEYQKSYWKNGNKNEFIITIGADKAGNVQWGDVISWTEIEDLKVDFRDYLAKMKIVSEESLIKLAEFSEKELGSRYVKPDFKKFDYLSVQPSKTVMIVIATIITLVTIGVVLFVIYNGIGNKDHVRPVSPKRPRPKSSSSNEISKIISSRKRSPRRSFSSLPRRR